MLIFQSKEVLGTCFKCFTLLSNPDGPRCNSLAGVISTDMDGARELVSTFLEQSTLETDSFILSESSFEDLMRTPGAVLGYNQAHSFSSNLESGRWYLVKDFYNGFHAAKYLESLDVLVEPMGNQWGQRTVAEIYSLDNLEFCDEPSINENAKTVLAFDGKIYFVIRGKDDIAFHKSLYKNLSFSDISYM